jgi:enoyl-CoA hydratase
MSYNNLLVTRNQQVATITINRPSQLNALNSETIDELHQALNELDADATVRVVILTGSGEKAFVAGADIKEFAHFSVEEGRRLSAEGHDKLFTRLEQLSKPAIAAINGFALGGGLELAMSCHVRIASDNARLGLPEVGLGVIPGYGGTQRLAQLVGKGKAMEMIVSASMIKADEALRCGLVNSVVTQADLMATAESLAAKIAANSPVAITQALKAVLAGYEDGVDGYAAEIEAFGACFGTPDFVEGTSAFLEKRKPQFAGHNS